MTKAEKNRQIAERAVTGALGGWVACEKDIRMLTTVRGVGVGGVVYVAVSSKAVRKMLARERAEKRRARK